MSGLQPVSFRKGREHAPRLSEPYVPGKRHPRFWTEEQDAVIRKHYPAGGVKACLAHLPGKTSGSIHQRALKLGLRSEKMPAERQRHELTPALETAIREKWALLNGRGAVAALADELGVPRWWLTKTATKLGLTLPHRKEPPWTAAENDLMRKVPLHDPDRCAKIFREHGFVRSPTAIVVRAKRLELSRRTFDKFSGSQAAKILGVDSKTMTSWIIAGEIAASRRGTRRLPQQGGDSWAIEPAELRRFVIEQLERIDFRKVDKFRLVALLAGEGQ